MKKERPQISFNIKERLKSIRSSMPLTKAILLAIYISYREHLGEKADPVILDTLRCEFNEVDIDAITRAFWVELDEMQYRELMKSLLEQYDEAQNEIIRQPHKLMELLGYLCSRNNCNRLYYPFCGVSVLSPHAFEPSFREPDHTSATELKTMASHLPRQILFTDSNPLHVALTRIWNTQIGWRQHPVEQDRFFDSRFARQPFDAIFLLPPFNLSQSTESLSLPAEISFSETHGELTALYLALQQLSVEGAVFTVLPASFCSDPAVAVSDLRLWLFEHRLIRRIITLPSKLYGNAAPAHTVLVELTAQPNESIQWIDASECTLSTLFVKDRTLLDVAAVVNLLEGESASSRTTPYPVITREESVNPASRLLTTPMPDSGFKWGTLDEVLQRIGTRGTPYPFSIVRQSDLCTDFFNSEIDDASLSMQYDNCERYALVSERCLVVATSGEEMHPSILHATDKAPIFLSNNVAAFRVRNDEIPLEYLCYALSLPFAKNQFLVRSAESAIQHISPENLLRLQIQLPESLGIPDALARMRDVYLTASDKAQKAKLHQLGIAYEQLQSEEFDRYKKEIHSRKHAVIQVLRKFSDTLDVIDIAREVSAGNLSDQFVVNRKTQATVANAFSELDGYMHQLNTMMDKFCDDTLSYGEPIRFSLGHFLNHYMEEHRSVKFRFEPLLTAGFFASDNLTIEGEEVVHVGDSLADVLFPEAALTQMLDNIISNAVEYGFFGRSSELNSIRFRVAFQNKKCILTVENNGHCLAENTDEERIFKFGESSKLLENGHTGQGLSQVRSLMREFKGDAQAVSNPDSDYPFAVQLIFND